MTQILAYLDLSLYLIENFNTWWGMLSNNFENSVNLDLTTPSGGQGSHKLWKSWETWKTTKINSMHGKIMEFKKTNWIIMEKSWNLWNNLMKSPVARKLAVGHLCVRQLVFSLLVVSSFKKFKMHAWSTSMLLLLHSTFMLGVVKMLLKGEAVH